MKARLLWTLLVVVLCGVLGAQVRLTTDTAAVLPRDSGLQDTLDRAQAFAGAQTLLFEVDGTGADRDALREAVAQLATGLEALPEIEAVRRGYGLQDGIDIQRRLTPYSTAFVPGPVLEERLSPEGIRSTLERQLTKLGSFQGMFQLNRVKDDPLDLIQLATETLAADAQPGVKPEDGMLLDASGARALVLVNTSLPPGAIVPDDPRVQAIQAVVDGMPLPTVWFGGHRMAYDTATAIAHDVKISAGLGMVLLATVLLVGFRTWRPVVGALGPAAIAAACASAAAWLASPVHALQLGFSAALAGLAVDYWVHLYLTAAQEPDQPDLAGRYAAALRALHHLAPALLVSAGSTALAFGLLTTSDLPIVRVLGLTGAAAAVGALLGTWLAGPLAWALLGRPAPSGTAPAPSALGTTGVLVLVLVLGFVGLSARFDADPLHLIARSDATARAESIFAERYGASTRRAIVLLDGATPAQALDRAKRVQDAFDRLGFVRSTGPTGVLPGPLAISEAEAAIPTDLQARIDTAAAQVGMPPLPGAADRVRERLKAPPLDLWTGSALEPKVALNGTDALVSVPLPDGSVVDALDDTLWATDRDATLAVPTEVAAAGMEQARGAIVSRALLGALAVFLFLTVRHRNPVTAAIALAPAAGAVFVAAGVVQLSGVPWNPVSLAAMVPVLGLAVDYGVFMTETSEAGSHRAVLLSALTTIAGFLTLGLADSPALFGVGVATVGGVAAAAAIALVAVPALVQHVWPGPRTRKAVTAVAFIATLVFFLDVGLVLYGAFTPPAVGPLPTGPLVETGNERRFGSTRFARTQGIWVLYAEGGPDQGYAINQVTQRIRPRLEDELFTTFETLVPNPFFRWVITRGSNLVGMRMHPYVPLPYQQEIRAGDLADPDPYWFKGPPYTRKIYYHAIHDLGQALIDTPLLACTGFMAGPGATADGHWLLARNFDSEVGVTFDRDKVVRVHRPDDGIPFLSVAFAGLAGAVSGVNEAGIAVAINASASDEPPRLGTPMTLIVREILEHATSLEDAERILRERNGFLSENVLVVDADHDRAALFEITPTRLARIDVQGSLAVSNHFRSPMFDDDATTAYRKAHGTTVQRLERMEELLVEHDGTLDLTTGVDLLKDRKGVGGVDLVRGHRQAIDADIATHGVVIDATTRTVRISRYPNLVGGWVELKLEDVLAGDLEATLVRPAEPDASVALGMRRARQVLLKQARWGQDPLGNTEEALRLLPGHPEALEARGEALWDVDREGAKVLLQQALDARPEYPHQVEAIEELLK